MILSDVQSIVIERVKSYFESMDIETEVNIETRLIGRNSQLDSMGLVNVIIDIEGCMMDNDLSVSLTSEKAMSAKNSPFKNIGTLSDFIYKQIV